MRSIQRMFMFSFSLVTVVAICLVSYYMSLYLDAYGVTRGVWVSISGIDVIDNPHNPAYVSVKTNLTVVNPTNLALKITYVSESLYLDTKYLGDTFIARHQDPIELHNNATIKIVINWISAEEVAMWSSKTWFTRVFMILDGVPFCERGARLTSYASYPGSA